MYRALLAWIGFTDLKARTGAAEGLGPIAQAVRAGRYDRLILLTNSPETEVQAYVTWLEGQGPPRAEVRRETLTGPTNHAEIFEAARRACESVVSDGRGTELTFHLSPGTPAMGAIWLLLAKTRYPAKLIESSKEKGVQAVDFPFDLAADYVPDLQRERDERLRLMGMAPAPAAPEFAAIIRRSRSMERVVEMARRVAPRDVPVLIEGESGVGKELLARAIHQASRRASRDPIIVNCGAIAVNLIESELFGYEKGAFTGADKPKKGFFEAAHGSTLFLDEVGELSTTVQVSLLRVVNSGEVLPVGGTKAVKVDVRIIAATNRTLTEEVAAGRFREDLFFRLAVAVIRLPPLRDREGDVGLLINHYLAALNRDAAREPGYQEKRLSAGARNLLLRHDWPGNARELVNTLTRLLIWSQGETITVEEAREHLLSVRAAGRPNVLDRPLGPELKLPDILNEVGRHYLARAMKEANGNKSRAAELVGLPSYQTLTNWLKKCEVQG